jgi:hypothetical protein
MPMQRMAGLAGSRPRRTDGRLLRVGATPGDRVNSLQKKIGAAFAVIAGGGKQSRASFARTVTEIAASLRG